MFTTMNDILSVLEQMNEQLMAYKKPACRELLTSKSSLGFIGLTASFSDSVIHQAMFKPLSSGMQQCR